MKKSKRRETHALRDGRTIAGRMAIILCLLLLFAWMLSEQPHIEKYREFWIKRGFDILTV